jgi:hypothetical protein
MAVNKYLLKLTLVFEAEQNIQGHFSSTSSISSLSGVAKQVWWCGEASMVVWQRCGEGVVWQRCSEDVAKMW